MEAELRKVQSELSMAKQGADQEEMAARDEAYALATQLQLEREKRVEHLRQVAARRIGQMELAKGWSAWHEQYLARLRCTQLLRNATSMISKPRLVASYKVWLHDWHEAQAAKTEKSYAVLLEDMQQQKKKLEVELNGVRRSRQPEPLTTSASPPRLLVPPAGTLLVE